MKLNQMYPSTYLKKEDVESPRVEIVSEVVQEEIGGDNGKELKPVIIFKSGAKMVLNKGNGTTLAENYGYDTDMWLGKPVELYVDKNVMFAGKRVGGLRLRVPGRDNGSSFHNSNSTKAGAWTWDEAVAEAAKWDISKEALIAELKANGSQGWNGARDTRIVVNMIEIMKTQKGEAFEPAPAGRSDDEIPFSWAVGFVGTALAMLPLIG